MPAQTEYTAPPSWGQSPYQDLVLPSGHTILVKLIDMQAIVAADMIDDFDKLSPVVDNKIIKPAKGRQPSDRPAKKPTKAERAAADSAQMREFFKKDNVEALTSMMGRVLPQVVIKPRIESHLTKTDGGKWVEIDHDDREEGVIYCDSIPLTDQMAILEFVMKGMDMDELTSFREQSNEDVGDLETVAERQDPPL